MGYRHAFCSDCGEIVLLPFVREHQELIHPGTWIVLAHHRPMAFIPPTDPSIAVQLDQAAAAMTDSAGRGGAVSSPDELRG